MGKIILHVEGRKLPKMDLLSKSDPYLCVFIGKKVFIRLNLIKMKSLSKIFVIEEYEFRDGVQRL